MEHRTQGTPGGGYGHVYVQSPKSDGPEIVRIGKGSYNLFGWHHRKMNYYLEITDFYGKLLCLSRMNILLAICYAHVVSFSWNYAQKQTF
jgi:hypothetical protein